MVLTRAPAGRRVGRIGAREQQRRASVSCLRHPPARWGATPAPAPDERGCAVAPRPLPHATRGGRPMLQEHPDPLAALGQLYERQLAAKDEAIAALNRRVGAARGPAGEGGRARADAGMLPAAAIVAPAAAPSPPHRARTAD